MDPDGHQLRIFDAITSLLVDDNVDTEDIINVLEPVIKFCEEKLATAKREASPG